LSDSSKFTQIANDGNLLPQTVVLQQTDQMGIAERFDIVIDFSRYTQGQSVQLVNLQSHVSGEEPGQILTVAEALGSGNCDPCVGACLQFNIIGPPPQQDQSVDPSGVNNKGIPLIPNPTFPASVRSRTFVFDHDANQDQDNPVTTYLGTGQWGIAAENSGGTSRHRGGSAQGRLRTHLIAAILREVGDLDAGQCRQQVGPSHPYPL
jgi:FtsP/CotA-like multicopper oxidase with cupredoxin domain